MKPIQRIIKLIKSFNYFVIQSLKSTRGLDALLVFHFLLIDDNIIKVYKRLVNKYFESYDIMTSSKLVCIDCWKFGLRCQMHI
jgi:hypothetical protein